VRPGEAALRWICQYFLGLDPAAMPFFPTGPVGFGLPAVVSPEPAAGAEPAAAPPRPAPTSDRAAAERARDRAARQAGHISTVNRLSIRVNGPSVPRRRRSAPPCCLPH
jgi:hypothetical protein